MERIPSSSTIIDVDSLDELDLLSASSTATLVGTPVPLATKQFESARSLRPRPPPIPTPTKSRKRTLSISAIANQVQKDAHKKMKTDAKRAVTIVLNAKRDERDMARKRWLHRHQDLFKPLLPPASLIFENIAREVSGCRDKKSYVPLHSLVQQPELVKGGLMKDYQLEGLSFLVWMYNNGMNCILGDEMGLGKTLQTLALFAYIKQNGKDHHDPHLVICPLSVLSSWQTEASRWLPALRTVRFHGVSNERQRVKDSFRTNDKPFDILITTYETYVAEESWFKSHRWTYCVLDEGHKIKNTTANISQKVQGLGSLYRLILTGTPVQNNLIELWSLLHWLYPTIFTVSSERIFKDAWDLSRGEYNMSLLTASHHLMSTVMLRRTKAVVDGDIPPREELTVFIPLTEAQRFWTYRLLTRMDSLTLEQIFKDSAVKKEENGVASNGRKEVFSHVETQIRQSSSGSAQDQWKKLMNLLMQLRKVCDHPYILPHAEPTPYVIGEHVVAASSKLIAIDKLLKEILPKGERVLIFAQWISMLDLLEDFLSLRSIPYARLEGSTSRPRRALDIKLFQQEKSPYQVYLISTKAGGLGINLTKASTVIMCDSDWNPQNDLQAIARAHRIGQTKTVKVYRLICRGTVEDQMLDRIRRKLFLSLKVMGSDNKPSSGDDNVSLASTELINILRKGSSTALGEDEKDQMTLERFLNAGIEEILDVSRGLEKARDEKIKVETEGTVDVEGGVDGKLLADAEEEERKLLKGVAQVQSRLFDGKIVNRHMGKKDKTAIGNKDIAMEWEELEKKRARVDRTVKVGGMTYIVAQPEVLRAPAAAPKAKRDKWEWEDWCIEVGCREGGELVMCPHCPRVFHAECFGVSPSEIRDIHLKCRQHACATCGRSTSDSGGMLFRCQTCPDAFCEDCLPDGKFHPIGDVLPEFAVLGYRYRSNAYYIRCHQCLDRFEKNPREWREWEEEIRGTQAKLDSLQLDS